MVAVLKFKKENIKMLFVISNNKMTKYEKAESKIPNKLFKNSTIQNIKQIKIYMQGRSLGAQKKEILKCYLYYQIIE